MLNQYLPFPGFLRKHLLALGLLVLLSAAAIAEEGIAYKPLKLPGIPVGGYEGRNIIDKGSEFLVLELSEGEAPLAYTLGPLKTVPQSLIEYRINIALEDTDADSKVAIALIARDKEGKELMQEHALGLTSPDVLQHAPIWQTVVGRAIMPPETYYVELRIKIGTPMKLHATAAGIRSIGKQVKPEDSSLTEKARISNGILDVVFNPQKNRFGILDNRNGMVWETRPIDKAFEVEKVQSGKLADGRPVIVLNGLLWTQAAPYRMTLTLDPANPVLRVRTEFSTSQPFHPVMGLVPFPSFKSMGPKAQWIIPARPESAYPVNRPDTETFTWEFKTNPAWFGQAVGEDGPAAMVFVPSFQHASAILKKTGSHKKDTASVINLQWHPFNGLWEYPRDMEIRFFKEGGAEAMRAAFSERLQAYSSSGTSD